MIKASAWNFVKIFLQFKDSTKRVFGIEMNAPAPSVNHPLSNLQKPHCTYGGSC